MTNTEVTCRRCGFKYRVSSIFSDRRALGPAVCPICGHSGFAPVVAQRASATKAFDARGRTFTVSRRPRAVPLVHRPSRKRAA